MRVTRIKGAAGLGELIAVPTTDGTGSVVIVFEVKPRSVIGIDRAGIAALRKALDDAEADYSDRTSDLDGERADSACDPSTRDRIFYKPQSITLPNGEVRHFSPPNPPFEPCPSADDCCLGGKVVKATHQAPWSKEDSSPQDGS